MEVHRAGSFSYQSYRSVTKNQYRNPSKSSPAKFIDFKLIENVFIHCLSEAKKHMYKALPDQS